MKRTKLYRGPFVGGPVDPATVPFAAHLPDDCRWPDWRTRRREVGFRAVFDESRHGLEDTRDPDQLAREVLRPFVFNGVIGVCNWHRGWHIWTPTHPFYREIDRKRFRPWVASRIDVYLKRLAAQGGTWPRTRKPAIGNTISAMLARVFQSSDTLPPAWMEGHPMAEAGRDPKEFVSVLNGILDFPAYTRREPCLSPHTPEFLSTGPLAPYRLDGWSLVYRGKVRDDARNN